MAAQIITKDYLNYLFEYKNGYLYWKNPNSKRVKPGQKVGSKNGDGYWHTTINGNYKLNHRLIFMMHHGYLPKIIDHIDNNPSNNLIENLRPASHSQNCHNSNISKTNKSGIKGIYWHKQSNKWKAQFKLNGKKIYFGTYYDIDYAKFVIEAMRYKYHKEFARG
jgi:hypothetical protein